MFQLFLPLLLLAAAGCALVFWMVGREDKSQREILSSVGFLGDTTGFLVTTGREGDFPSRPGLDETALKAELDRMVELAAQGRYNAIFFQARPGGMALYQSKYFDPHPDLEGAKGLGAFDPLGYLCDAAGQRQLRVYALLDLSQAPDALTKKAMETQAEISGGGFDLTQPGTAELMARSTAEVGKNYPLGGILLAGLDGLEDEDAREVLTGIRARMTKEGGAAALGLLLDGDRPDDGLGAQGAAALGREGLVGLIMPRITAASTGEDGCASLLARWAREPAGSAKVVPLCPAAPRRRRTPIPWPRRYTVCCWPPPRRASPGRCWTTTACWRRTPPGPRHWPGSWPREKAPPPPWTSRCRGSWPSPTRRGTCRSPMPPSSSWAPPTPARP